MCTKRTVLFFVLLFIGSWWLSARAGVSEANEMSYAYHKVVAPAGLLNEQMKGVELLQVYGSYSLYRITAETWEILPADLRMQLQLVDEMDRLLFASQVIDTRQPVHSPIAPFSVADTKGVGLYLVQFIGPIREEWLAFLLAQGIEPVHYVANNGYLVWTDEDGRFLLNQLAREKTFIQYAAPYHLLYRLGPSILARLNQPPKTRPELVHVEIQMLRHPDLVETTEQIEKLLVTPLSDWEPVLNFQNRIAIMAVEDVLSLASLPGVVWVGERFEREKMDEIQGVLMTAQFDTSGTGPKSPGYLSWLTSLGFSTDPLDYPIVDITDDGIGNGTINTGDPTFHQFGNATNPTRVVYIENCTGAADGGGEDGHGHLNLSIAGGYDARSGFPYVDNNGYQRGLGINPFGRFAGTRVFGPSFDLSQCGGTESGLIERTYFNGAQISSNSWGCSFCASIYDLASQAYDAGTRDASPSTPGNQELLFIFSAGNSGPGNNTIGTPGNAKNVVTVGASEGVRPDWTDGCNIGPSGADSAMDISEFSSRGPAPGGRVKPDVVAPGSHIQGTASTNSAYDGEGVCDLYHPSDQVVFAASSGTSHSTPAVAGAMSLYTYWLENRYGLLQPSPALLKAYLLAHVTYLTGDDANDDLPSPNQGFGMPDLTAAFDETPRYFLDQTVVLSDSGETWRVNVSVADLSRPVRVVLVYTDAPGLVGTSPQVNDLNLRVGLDGTDYWGNQLSGQWSVSGGTADPANNVEVVYLPPGTTGNLSIEVSAFNIAGDGVPGNGDDTDQDFALVCYNCAQKPEFSLRSTPLVASMCTPGSVSYDLTLNPILGFSQPVTLTVSGLPSGVFGSFDVNPVTLPGSSQLTVAAGTGASAGGVDVVVTGTAVTTTHQITMTLDLFTAVPAAVTLQSPVNNATSQPIKPVFTWLPVDQAANYTIEIATDPGFTNIIETANLLTTSYQPSELTFNTNYYWRVRANNECGSGANSPVYQFNTEPAPGQCAIGSTSLQLVANNFDIAATANWSHTGLEDTWRLDSTRVHSGNFSFYAEDVDRVSDQILFSPPVALPAKFDSLTLQFWNYQAIEAQGSTGCYDGAVVEISTDGGASWQSLESYLLTDPYDGMISSGFGNPLAGAKAWCGNPQDWMNSVVSLDDFGGQTVQFRFRLATDESIGKEGWYIDDVVVQACSAGLNNRIYFPVVGR